MSSPNCCGNQVRAGAHARRSASWLRRGARLAGWVIPSAGLALIPKCPVCVAAYVAVATGIGISLPTAEHLRIALIGLCIASLTLIVARRVRSLIAHRVGADP
jgi:hypothetical protein